VKFTVSGGRLLIFRLRPRIVAAEFVGIPAAPESSQGLRRANLHSKVNIED